MPLRLRRGTDTERQSITPQEGELIYVTDTKELWAGDGVTVGGVKVTGNIPESLNDLNDVDTVSNAPQIGQVLKWDGSAFVPGDDNTTISLSINDLTDVNLFGVSTGDSLIWDGVQFVVGNTNGVIEGSNYRINIVGSDSSIILDAENKTFIGDVTGNLTGNVIGELSGTMYGDLFGNLIGNSSGTHLGDVRGNVEGDIIGSLFGDDSTLIVDGLTNTIYGNLIGDVTGDVVGDVFGNIFGDVEGNLIGDVQGDVRGNVIGSIIGQDSSVIIDSQFNDIYPRQIKTGTFLRITNDIPNSTNFVQMESNDQFTSLSLVRNSENDLAGNNDRYGQLRFGRDDINGKFDTCIISGNEDFLWLFNSPSGAVTENKLFTIADGDIGVGTVTPTEKLDVRGNVAVSGNLTAAAIKGSIVADDSTILIDGTTGSLLTANIDVVGSVGTPSVGAGDLANVNEWLQVTVNGNTRYIPLYA